MSKVNKNEKLIAAPSRVRSALACSLCILACCASQAQPPPHTSSPPDYRVANFLEADATSNRQLAAALLKVHASAPEIPKKRLVKRSKYLIRIANDESELAYPYRLSVDQNSNLPLCGDVGALREVAEYAERVSDSATKPDEARNYRAYAAILRDDADKCNEAKSAAN
jgi:hypothetical protein